MLCGSTASPGSPEAKRIFGQLFAHQFNDLPGRQPKLFSDRVKGRSVFPGHLDHSIELFA
jgi:hypothetical protein